MTCRLRTGMARDGLQIFQGQVKVNFTLTARPPPPPPPPPASARYETIAFKVPNVEVDKSEGKFQTSWDADSKTFSVQMFFKRPPSSAPSGGGGGGVRAPPPPPPGPPG